MTSKLRTIQEDNKLELIGWSDTRWSAEQRMIERFLKLAKFIEKILLEEKDSKTPIMLTSSELSNLKHLNAVLIPFGKAVRSLEKEGIILPKLPKIIHRLLNELDPQGHMSIFHKNVLETAKSAVQRRLGGVVREPGLPLMAAALHPKYGHLEWLTDKERDLVWIALEKELPNFPVKTKSNALHGLRTIRLERSKVLECARINMESKEFCEMSPSEFWKAFESENGKDISSLVRGILSIPASTARVERVFSSTGFIEDGREQMSIDTLEMHAIIRDFMKSSNYNFEKLVQITMKSDIENAK